MNGDPEFVERIRLHQLASGQDLRPRPLRDLNAGTGVHVRTARVTAVDVEGRTVELGGETLAYDTLVYAMAAPSPFTASPASRSTPTTWPAGRPPSGCGRAWARWSPAGPC
ncbi:hypothetical protein [Nonomuraea coxensis]|uniref:hypothetical protein n=1 Tax=Nonomuraea coxensis TaxID=404386 RepID=UPI0003A2B26B|nr:hypothetical protein [Nonomuraea coxensis]